MDLFQPFQLRGASLPNRVMLSPMQQYQAVDGLAQPWHLVHLGSRAVGRVGLVMTEATAVSAEGRSTVGDLGLWRDDQAEALRPIAGFVHSQGAAFGVQLGHAGRKGPRALPWEPRGAGGGWVGLGATGRPFEATDAPPRRATDDDLKRVVEAFSNAARRAAQAGADWIEVHAAHGYLIHELLSPLTNDRNDHWGVDLDGRARLCREVVGAVRAVFAGPIAVRLSIYDRPDAGWSVDDTVSLGRALAADGADLLVASAGGVDADSKLPPLRGEHHGLVGRLRETGLAVGVVGGVHEPSVAQALVASGAADLVALARVLLREPYWMRRAAEQLGATLAAPPPYARGW